MYNLFNKSLPSVMQHSFSRVPMARIPRTAFDMPYRNVTTLVADYIVPFFNMEVMPGDTLNAKFAAVIRPFSPFVAPLMDNLYSDYFFFFVPNRIVQDNWEKLQGAQDNPGDSISFSSPKLTSPATIGYVPPADWSSPTTAELASALQDHFGIPVGVPDLEHHNYLGRGYNKIVNEWFRDQNIDNSYVVDVDDGPDTVTDYILLKRNKKHDYFTSCLPWLQKGTAESLPLGTSAPIVSTATGVDDDTNRYVWQDNAGDGELHIASSSAMVGDIYADLTSATGATIGALYESFAIQDLLQRDARGGTRYVEILQSHFGVTSPDFRLQRPEYLGGASKPFIINALAQTSETATTELGTLAAQGAASASMDVGFFKSFVEHGHVFGFVNIRADLTYQEGLHRDFSRSTRYDWYFPALANLPEQEVYNKEIYAQGTAADDNVFGYQERWAEYKYGKSLVTGRMRSNAANNVDEWHLSEDFTSLPSLNSAFLKSNVPMDRVLSITTEPHFYADFYGKINAVRPMPLYSVPGLQNRF